MPPGDPRIGHRIGRGSSTRDLMQFDQPKRREPAKPRPLSTALLWLLGGVAVALAALPVIFAGSPASEPDKAITVLTTSSVQSEQDEGLTVLAASSIQNALDDINADRKSTRLNSSHLGISYA